MQSPKKWLIVVIAVAIAMCVCFVVLCSNSPRVVSEADLADGSHAYMINVDGSGFTRIDDFDDDGRGFLYPISSSDGSQLAFFRMSTEEGIYTSDWDNPSLTRITSDSIAGYRLSPDLSKIACVDEDDECIYIYNGDGSGKTEIPGGYESGINTSSGKWSPDSSKIAYTSTGEYVIDQDIYVIDVIDKTKTKVFELSGNPPFVKWAPDSATLYCVEGSDTEEHDLYAISADGTGAQKIAEDMRSIYYISPDGSRIIYSTNSGSYMMNADGSGKVELSDNADCMQYKWSSDGSKIAYMDGIWKSPTSDLYVMNADGSNQWTISSGPPIVTGYII